MNAVTVSVDYTEYLRATLPYNRRHFDRFMVVSADRDRSLIDPLAKEHHLDVYYTDVFWADGADFNKFRGMEEGLDALVGRAGWLCILDADTVWPSTAKFPDPMRTGHLYVPWRRVKQDWVPGVPIPPEDEWERYPRHWVTVDYSGYSQVFHAADPYLGLPPWHSLLWRHAGGGDTEFQKKWPEDMKVRPPFEVLHLGPTGRNWCGVGNEAKLRQYMRGRRTDPSLRSEKLA